MIAVMQYRLFLGLKTFGFRSAIMLSRQSNDAHHWRGAMDDRNANRTSSPRPVQAPNWAIQSWGSSRAACHTWRISTRPDSSDTS